jgi:hypothetical protein
VKSGLLGAGLAVLAVAATPTATAQAPPTCPPGTEANVTLTTEDKGRSVVVATHEIDVTADIGASDPRNIQIVPQPGVEVVRRSSDGSIVTLFAPTASALGLTVSWTQPVDESDSENTLRCSASRSFTLPVQSAIPARGAKQPNPGPATGDYTFAIASAEAKRADLRPLELSIRSTAHRRFPRANERLRTWAIPMRDAEQVNYHKKLPNLAYATTPQKCRFWWFACGPAFAHVAELNYNDKALNRGRELPDLDGSNAILRDLAYSQPSRWAAPLGIVIQANPGVASPQLFGYDIQVRQGGRLLARVRRAGRCQNVRVPGGIRDFNCKLSRNKTLLR